MISVMLIDIFVTDTALTQRTGMYKLNDRKLSFHHNIEIYLFRLLVKRIVKRKISLQPHATILRSLFAQVTRRIYAFIQDQLFLIENKCAFDFSHSSKCLKEAVYVHGNIT